MQDTAGDLRHADFRGSDLTDAYLGDANLEAANFQDAVLSSETVLPDGARWARPEDLEY